MYFSEKTVLITGGAGAIGSSLARKMVTLAKKVIILDDLSSGFKSLVPISDNLIFIEGSIVDDGVLDRVFNLQIDIVYHLAANFANQNSVDNPIKDLNVNGLGTLKLLEYVKNNKCSFFLYASSSCVYGDMNDSGDEKTSSIKLDTPYAITKMLGENYVNYYRTMYNLPSVIFRIFNSYGPGEYPGKYRNVIPNFIQLAIEKKPLSITGNGHETRAFNYIDNLISAFLLAATTPDAIGYTFNIGTDKQTSIIELANTINDVANNPAGIKYLPRREWDHVSHRYSNIALAKKILNYSPINNLRNGIETTYDWLIKNHRI